MIDAISESPDDSNNSNIKKEKETDDNNIDNIDDIDMNDSLRPNICDSWSPSGSKWKDFLHFAGPGWLISIAYVDPGNYQADIQAGATSGYSLLCIIWWTTILSMYVQILCVRLAQYGGLSLAEVQAKYATSNAMRYFNWFIAEFSTVITDLPEVIGIGIALQLFFNWPYWIGVVLSLLTTMIFLLTVNYGIRILETVVAGFLGIMGIVLFIELGFIGVDVDAMMRGWTIGIVDLESKDIFSILGVCGAVVMPHNLYLHSGASKSHAVSREYVEDAVFYSSIEPILPVLVTFAINLAVVCIAARSLYGNGIENVENVGLTDFCPYFKGMASGGCVLWGIALLSAGQSSAITTTYTGQYVMDGFLNLQLSVRVRAIVTRLIAITPCVIVSLLFPNKLNHIINVVNALISFLLPFAFTPLVKFNCNETVMGDKYVIKGMQKYVLHGFAFCVWLINAFGLSVKGGGFFGDMRQNKNYSLKFVFLEIFIQSFYAWWNWNCITYNIHSDSGPLLEENDDDNDDGFAYNYDDEQKSVNNATTTSTRLDSDLSSSDKENAFDNNDDLCFVISDELEII